MFEPSSPTIPSSGNNDFKCETISASRRRVGGGNDISDAFGLHIDTVGIEERQHQFRGLVRNVDGRGQFVLQGHVPLRIIRELTGMQRTGTHSMHREWGNEHGATRTPS